MDNKLVILLLFKVFLVSFAYIHRVKGLLTICFWFSVVFGQCQSSIDLFTVSFKHGFSQPIEGYTGSATDNVVLANLKAPIVFSESTIWYSELTYQGFVVDYSEDYPGTINPTRLHGFILQTGLVQKLSETTGFQLLFAPRFMSDLKHVDGDHFQYGGLGLFEKKYSDRLLMRYGLMYNGELFGEMFVPLVYLDWKITSKWSVTGLFPIFGKLNFQANDKVGVGLSLFGLITSFQIGDPAFNGDYIERKSVDLTLFARYQMVGNLHFETRFGYALGRSYSQFSKDDEVDFRIAIASFGDVRNQKNAAFEPGPILDMRLVYNLPLK